ncbi:MAG: hypothetical protein EXQ55_02265 [Acidobacteria bacterium]|nr:hypothetical protein [Acidobacteriota bacterium]
MLLLGMFALFAIALPRPGRSSEPPPPGAVNPSGLPQAVPLKTRWEGTWESSRGYRFSFVMHLTIAADNEADGYILWRLLHTPPGSGLADRVNEPGTEFVRGSVDLGTGELELTGYRVDNPTLLATDRYRFFISSGQQTFRGLSRDNDGNWETAINGTISVEN